MDCKGLRLANTVHCNRCPAYNGNACRIIESLSKLALAADKLEDTIRWARLR